MGVGPCYPVGVELLGRIGPGPRGKELINRLVTIAYDATKAAVGAGAPRERTSGWLRCSLVEARSLANAATPTSCARPDWCATRQGYANTELAGGRDMKERVAASTGSRGNAGTGVRFQTIGHGCL